MLTGLFNQHCKLLDFLTLASVLKPDKVALTNATKRGAFAAVQTWSVVPLGSLWDEESIAAFLAGTGQDPLSNAIKMSLRINAVLLKWLCECLALMIFLNLYKRCML